MIPAMAIITQVPANKERGSFMSLNSSVQSAAMALGSVIGGWLSNGSNSTLASFELNGWVAAVTSLLSIGLLMLLIDRTKIKGAASAT